MFKRWGPVSVELPPHTIKIVYAVKSCQEAVNKDSTKKFKRLYDGKESQTDGSPQVYNSLLIQYIKKKVITKLVTTSKYNNAKAELRLSIGVICYLKT